MGRRPRHRDDEPGAADALTALRRYAPIVDDLEAFLEAAGRPLPRVAWANPLKGDPEATVRALRARCPEAEPLGWRPHALRLPADAKPGAWPETALGLCHVQEEASIWAADAVGAQPGERVADLCAAPGTKTAHLAVAMQDRGALVANERQQGRLSPLRANLERLGVTCALVVHGDGLALPAPAGGWDRVLVDAPCSGEGTTRKNAPNLDRRPAPPVGKYVSVQRGLLRRALERTRPGGVVVYSTCTYAPEENEGVLDAIDPSMASIEPLDVPTGLRAAPGVAAWMGRGYRPDVAHARRLWPHHNDTGGFFLARLRRH